MISGGRAYGASRVTVAGRIAAIAIDPSNGRNRVLIGAAGGGVWESGDAGANSGPRAMRLPALTIGAIAFDPSHPQVAYCGTGEGNWYNRWGQGVLRSTDGGTTWTLQAGAPFIGQGFHDLVVDFGQLEKFVAATTGGVYTSADAGVTWTQRRTHRCWSLAMAPGEFLPPVMTGCSAPLTAATHGLRSRCPARRRLEPARCCDLPRSPSFAMLSVPPALPPTSPLAMLPALGTRSRARGAVHRPSLVRTVRRRCSQTMPIPSILAPLTSIAAIRGGRLGLDRYQQQGRPRDGFDPS